MQVHFNRLAFVLAVASFTVIWLLVGSIRTLQRVYDPPTLDELPEIAMASSGLESLPVGTPGTTLEVQVVVKNCEEPVQVRVGYYLSARTRKHYPQLSDPRQTLSLATSPAKTSRITLFQGLEQDIALFTQFGDYSPPAIRSLGSGLKLVPLEGENYRIANQRPSLGKNYSLATYTASMRDPGKWSNLAPRRYGVGQPTIQAYGAHFEANWLRPRGHGSCYIMLPDSNGSRVFEAQAVADLLERSGKTTGGGPPRKSANYLTPDSRIELSLAQPPPDNFRRNQWPCTAYHGSNGMISPAVNADCAAVVPFVEPGSANEVAGGVLIRGVFIGLLSALLVESLMRLFRRPSAETSTPA